MRLSPLLEVLRISHYCVTLSRPSRCHRRSQRCRQAWKCSAASAPLCSGPIPVLMLTHLVKLQLPAAVRVRLAHHLGDAFPAASSNVARFNHVSISGTSPFPTACGWNGSRCIRRYPHNHRVASCCATHLFGVALARGGALGLWQAKCPLPRLVMPQRTELHQQEALVLQQSPPHLLMLNPRPPNADMISSTSIAPLPSESSISKHSSISAFCCDVSRRRRMGLARGMAGRQQTPGAPLGCHGKWAGVGVGLL